MDFDQLSVALLVLRDDAPELTEIESAALQDAHMAHLADLHEAGHLVAAGPLMDDRFRGLSLLTVDPSTAMQLKSADPAVVAGRFEVLVFPWFVPAGAMHFTSTTFPRSMADLS